MVLQSLLCRDLNFAWVSASLEQCFAITTDLFPCHCLVRKGNNIPVPSVTLSASRVLMSLTGVSAESGLITA